jgi:hypothetical protein
VGEAFVYFSAEESFEGFHNDEVVFFIHSFSEICEDSHKISISLMKSGKFWDFSINEEFKEKKRYCSSVMRVSCK